MRKDIEKEMWNYQYAMGACWVETEEWGGSQRGYEKNKVELERWVECVFVFKTYVAN